jgi:hypothetical protein
MEAKAKDVAEKKKTNGAETLSDPNFAEPSSLRFFGECRLACYVFEVDC